MTVDIRIQPAKDKRISDLIEERRFRSLDHDDNHSSLLPSTPKIPIRDSKSFSQSIPSLPRSNISDALTFEDVNIPDLLPEGYDGSGARRMRPRLTRTKSIPKGSGIWAGIFRKSVVFLWISTAEANSRWHSAGCCHGHPGLSPSIDRFLYSFFAEVFHFFRLSVSLCLVLFVRTFVLLLYAGSIITACYLKSVIFASFSFNHVFLPSTILPLLVSISQGSIISLPLLVHLSKFLLTVSAFHWHVPPSSDPYMPIVQ